MNSLAAIHTTASAARVAIKPQAPGDRWRSGSMSEWRWVDSRNWEGLVSQGDDDADPSWIDAERLVLITSTGGRR